MKKIIQIILVLTIVGIISGASLVLVYNYTSPLILINQKKITEEAIYKVFPDGTTYKKIEKTKEDIFLVEDKTGKKLGYAFIAEGNGYQGKIDIMVGIKPDLKTLTGIEILESQETPGLGQEITGNKFENQFINLQVSPEIDYVRGKKPSKPNEIQAITGATISSKSVVSIINNGVKNLKKTLK